MKVHYLAAVDSTSTEAARRLAGGEAPPFAVLADAQTGGKGRRGTQWESPEGNLYLTVALPPPREPAAQHGLLPLKTGVLVARFLAGHAALRVTLKWPNDLLVEGKKLGGLLLEGSHAGGVAGAVLAGIGINVRTAPDLQDAPYQAVSLADATGRTFDARRLGQDLITYLAAEWDLFALSDVSRAFSAFALPPRSLWQDGSTYLTDQGVAPSGALRLGELELTSADHGWRWVHQGAAPLVVADCGNTSLKLACFPRADAPEPTWRRQIAWANLAKELPGALDALAAEARTRPWPIFAGSVHPAGVQELTRVARAHGFTVEILAKRPVRRHGQGYELNDLGIDRLAAVEGWARLKRGKAVVVVAGTATTIDVVGAHGEHLGGYILPGLKTALASLHQAASLLPALDPQAEALPPESALGHDTRSAMLGGALRMTAAAIAETARECDAPVILAGGYAEALQRWLPDAEVSGDLVVSGLRVLAL